MVGPIAPVPPTVTQSTNVYEFMIFSKTGSCLFHLDFTGTINFEKERDKNSEVFQRQKLVYGLICGIKSFSQMVRLIPITLLLALHQAIAMLPKLFNFQIQIPHLWAADRPQTSLNHSTSPPGPVWSITETVPDTVRASGFSQYFLQSEPKDLVQTFLRESVWIPLGECVILFIFTSYN